MNLATTKPPIQKRHADALKDWKITYIGYGVTHYVLVILGVLAGAVVTASSAIATTTSTSEPFIQPIVSAFLGILAAASITITNALDTGSKYKRFNKAWVILNSAIMRYETEPDFKIENVNNAYETGENVILEKTEEKKD